MDSQAFILGLILGTGKSALRVGLFHPMYLSYLESVPADEGRSFIPSHVGFSVFLTRSGH
jgi:hypothetical protein